MDGATDSEHGAERRKGEVIRQFEEVFVEEAIDDNCAEDGQELEAADDGSPAFDNLRPHRYIVKESDERHSVEEKSDPRGNQSHVL